MKRYRVFILSAFLGLGVVTACDNPVIPYPQDDEEENKKDPEDPNKQGFVLDGIDNSVLDNSLLSGVDIYFA